MPHWLTEISKYVGDQTLFITAAAAYAAVAYGFFHWLDKKVSRPATQAISAWLQPKAYDKAAVSEAIIEIFNRLYTAELLSWRAFWRSSVITICMMIIPIYALYQWRTQPFGLADSLSSFLGTLNLIVIVITSIVSDYISLFVVKYWLTRSKQEPILSILIGPAAAAVVIVIVLTVVRLVADELSINLYFGFAPSLWEFIAALNFPLYFSLRAVNVFTYMALIVHAWMPLLVVCVCFLRALNYLREAVGWTRWFIRGGRDHPLQAVGYVAAVLVFIGAVTADLVAKQALRYFG